MLPLQCRVHNQVAYGTIFMYQLDSTLYSTLLYSPWFAMVFMRKQYLLSLNVVGGTRASTIWLYLFIYKLKCGLIRPIYAQWPS